MESPNTKMSNLQILIRNCTTFLEHWAQIPPQNVSCYLEDYLHQKGLSWPPSATSTACPVEWFRAMPVPEFEVTEADAQEQFKASISIDGSRRARELHGFRLGWGCPSTANQLFGSYRLFGMRDNRNPGIESTGISNHEVIRLRFQKLIDHLERRKLRGTSE